MFSAGKSPQIEHFVFELVVSAIYALLLNASHELRYLQQLREIKCAIQHGETPSGPIFEMDGLVNLMIAVLEVE